NTILAQNCLDDIIKGYNITLKDCVLSRELMTVVDGGDFTGADYNNFAKYTSPVAGRESKRTKFTLRLYASEKDYGGNSVAFFRFTFPNCFGTPAKFSFEEGSFATPEYTVRSRPGAGDYAMTVECLDSLPIYCGSASELPEAPKSGDCIIATADITVGAVSLGVGDMAYYDGESYVKVGAVSA
ncbi:MAG: hypothetical protein IJP17_01970, partial [Clostridia bacterium]|nr:hypothetical protein [Clostridia bacterium]